MTLSLASVLLISLAFNAYLYFLLHKARKRKVPTLDVSASDLLHDLTRRGGAILKVEVINPEHLFLRSPR